MSWLIGNIIEGRYTWTIPIVFCLIILDIVLIHLIKKNELSIKNKYFELHERFGYLKLNFFKIIFALLNLWQALKPVRYNSLGYFLALLIYTCIVIKLLLDFLKEKKSKKKGNFL